MALAEPTAVLVPPRILRRVIKRDRGLWFFNGGAAAAAARQTAYEISGEALGAIVGGAELGRPAGATWPNRVLLIACPEPEELETRAPGAVLTTAWRRLFRARVVSEVRQACNSGAIDAAGLASRVASLGRTEFEEARSVLRQDGWVGPENDEAAVYAAFAAVFLDLTRFAPALRGYTFPAIEDPSAVEALLSADVDVPSLLSASRPPGAPDPGTPADSTVVPDEPEFGPDLGTVDGEERERHRGAPGRGRARRLAAKAKEAAARGNNVRAAILWAGSGLKGGAEAGEADRAGARSELKHLADRFTSALFVRKGDAEVWADALAPLLRRAARGFWSPEARLLYDLQKVCIDHEREVFRIDAVGWALALGRRPLTRPLPHLRVVAMSNHLRGAALRLPKVRLSREERGRLEGLLRVAVHRVEHDLREQFRPSVDAALAATWVRPRDLPERVALVKLVEELLDRIVARGFTTLGDLRDAASQGNLKLPDLTGPSEFFGSDRLLKADRALADRLDGVHRRGEVYLRWLQRFSSVAFGTRVGRLLSRFVALPFGGAFVLLKGLQEIDEMFVSHLVEFVTNRHALHHQFVNAWSTLLLGLVAMGAVNFAAFRRRLLDAVLSLGRTLRAVFVDLPSWLLNNPLLLRVLGSRVVEAAWNFGVKPALVAFVSWAIVWLAGLGPADAAGAGLGAFLTACLVFNTRAGRTLEELAAEKVTRALRALAFDVLPGLFQLVMSGFERLLEWVEKLIYAVDEWFRFRTGQSRGVLAAKAVLGLVWGVVAYLVRVYVNLLIEPQVNPIKHFPVVTVSHKVILPMSLKIGKVFAAVLIPILGKDLGLLVAGANVLLLPGVFGFLVWELKSNWQLYEANRPASLGPLSVGSHGETVVDLLRPGFHSGTLPRLYGRLRRARRGGREGAALKRREALHHVEESIRRFVERELCALLHGSRSLGRESIRLGAIHLATNRVRIEFLRSEPDASGLWVDIEERSGSLAAGVSRPGWLTDLDPEETRTLSDALAGFYKMSGVSLIHSPGDPFPPLNPVGVIALDDVTIPWRDWVDDWESEVSGTRPPSGVVGWPGRLPDPEDSRHESPRTSAAG